jgi:hypothetical protein
MRITIHQDGEATTRRRKALLVAAVACTALFMFAFIAAPYSCEWGNEAYAWTGAGALLLLAVTPFLLGAGSSLLRRVGFALGLLAIGSAVWLAGFFMANFRIICRLF